jgi:hypothetical protein
MPQRQNETAHKRREERRKKWNKSIVFLLGWLFFMHSTKQLLFESRSNINRRKILCAKHNKLFAHTHKTHMRKQVLSSIHSSIHNNHA